MEGVRMNRITLADPLSEVKDGQTLSGDVKRKLLNWQKNHHIDCYNLMDIRTGELVNTNHYGLVFTKDESNTLIHLMAALRLENKKFLVQINGMIKDVDGMVDEIDEVQKELRDADKRIRKAIEAEREEYNLRVKAYEKEVSGLKWLLKKRNKHPLVKLIRRLPWVRL
jgi:hypothetical protein